MSNERLPPLVFRFVSGTSSTAQERRVVRSHAMTEYRRRQRQGWLLSTATTRQKQRISAKSKSEDEDDICGCLQPPSQPMEVLSPLLNEEMANLPISYQFCLRCGRERPIDFNSIFFESHERGLALQIVSPSFIADLGQGEFDPFHSMPGLSYSLKEDQIAEINIVKAYALTFCLPNPIKSVVFPEMVSNPALCMAVLYMAYAFLASVRGWFDHTVALTMKQASITYVNKTLTSLATATQSGTMASIAFLTSGIWAFGSDGAPIEVGAHSAGLEAIVTHRNGLNTLTNDGFEQILRKFLVMQHFLICALSGAYPSIIYLSDFEEICTAPESNILLQECPLYCPTENFQSLRQSKRYTPQILRILILTRDLIEIFLGSASATPESNEILGPRLTSLRTELESFPPAARIYAGISKDASNHNSLSVSALARTKSAYIYESIRLASLITLRVFVHKLSSFTDVSENLTQALISALKHTDIGGTWGDMLGPLYWVALTGSACGQGKPMHRFLDSTLGRAMFEMGYTVRDFRCTVVPVKRFADLHRKLALRRDSA
ncbi:hypothetical protein POJ06DRAFT_243890 [Lipomyces tetrasporus]|uniref:Uncharacterized protein n=1 Tax=Lipomyces tetrasporus TaxID=54092 RepID=A0AAD7R0B8_9ASCO|nr:uncharacterized protein POJ06DRAFT_243890 [Lipomyces tetrasporus]KAJ8104196.1 hypothetical protein POJ06DRAFT_243890 [Lipomyces tetrasporus]